MFGLFKSKNQSIVSPADGDVIKLEEVEDEVFSTKMAGDGVAIIPRSNTFVAPVSGVVSKIFSTNHAFSIRTHNGLEVLVHIGLDTVELNGEGFKRLVEEGEKVSMGKPIIYAELELIKTFGKSVVTPIVINAEVPFSIVTKNLHTVREGETLMEITFQ